MAKVINVLGAGGLGINLAATISRMGEQPGFATLRPYYIDTSRSNMGGNVDMNFAYHIEGMDGSGKKRDTNHAAIAELIPQILHKFKPTSMNIVIHSLSGGSGSVIGPSIVSELLDKKIPVIVIMVGSTASRKEVENTIKTIKTYENIAKIRKQPVNAIYYENSKEQNRFTIDDNAKTMLTMLAAFLSGENPELDGEDVVNFLAYPNVTSYAPMLSRLSMHSKAPVLIKGEHVVAVTTLTDAKSDASIEGINVEYQATGFVSPNVEKVLGSGVPWHLIITQGYFHGIIERLSSLVAEFDSVRSSVVHKAILDKDDGGTDNGLVL